MQSSAKTVSDYLEEVPDERRIALSHIRKLCNEILIGFEERMEYGMPVYTRNGVAEVGFASQKHFIAIYILKSEVLEVYRGQLVGKGISLGKGCIRYSKPERIEFNLVATLLKATRLSSAQVCD